MQKRSRLSKYRQSLVVEYMPLARMLARFFVQNRPPWQRSVLIPDLESEGFLALSKAARTYDKTKLPYPKAYFARAVLNAMYKWIRKATRQPADWRITLEEAAHLLPVIESPDYLRLAIDDLGEDAELASDRFRRGMTLRAIAECHSLSLRTASLRSRQIATRIAAALDIRLQPRVRERRDRSEDRGSDHRASPRRRGKNPGQ